MPRFFNDRFGITAMVSEWSRAYEVPPAAIERQIPIAHAWCNSNPMKAPKRNPMRFLHNWMRLAKKYGNLTVEARKDPWKDKPVHGDMSVEEMQEIRRRNFGELRR